MSSTSATLISCGEAITRWRGTVLAVSLDLRCLSLLLPSFWAPPRRFVETDPILDASFFFVRSFAAFKSSLLTIHKESTGQDIVSTQLGKPHKTTYDFVKVMLDSHRKETGLGPVVDAKAGAAGGDEGYKNVWMVGGESIFPLLPLLQSSISSQDGGHVESRKSRAD